IGMAKVHLANVPRHIGRRKCDLQSGGDAMLVHRIDVVHPDRHPDTFVALFVSVVLKRGGVRAAAAASLRSLTKKDARFLARSNRAKRRRRSPVPQFLPSPLLKPRERAGDVGHVQYRSQTFGFHNRSRITPSGSRGFGQLEGSRRLFRFDVEGRSSSSQVPGGAGGATLLSSFGTPCIKSTIIVNS